VHVAISHLAFDHKGMFFSGVERKKEVASDE